MCHSFELQISVSRHDNSPVLVNGETKRIVIEKSKRFLVGLMPTIFDFELNANATAHIELPTLEDDNFFYLKVRIGNMKAIILYYNQEHFQYR